MMFSFQANRTTSIAKALTISAIGMVVGFGTCGVGVTIAGASSRLAQFMFFAGAILFFVSLTAFTITVLVAIVMTIAKAFRK